MTDPEPLQTADQGDNVSLVRQPLQVTDRVTISHLIHQPLCKCQSPVSAAYRTGSYTKFLCERCLLKTEERQRVPLGPCVCCAIPVFAGFAYANYYIRHYSLPTVCSAECNKAHHLKQRKDARTQARTERPCATCGQQFTPKRADAKTCSNKCRQALFRRRGNRVKFDANI